ncbi:protein FAM161A-like isoform X2 [Myxocyprinus asiaticus]|uniref:protein FAM161A-like isoform X2 n=1 Tax=Myxocyprinus asiaticus TaxID=70543 RepID=UPI002221DE11|nr:protein FAM161A-like isoform X2 [Myxocyprinus asiaticus]
MTLIQRTEMLQPSELHALFGEEKDYSCSLTEIVHHTEECEQHSEGENTAESMCDFSSLSASKYGQPFAASHLQRQVFSNQAYNTKLEELKREHLRNIAELEKLYLSKLTPGQRETQLISSRKERQQSIDGGNKKDTESEHVEPIQVGGKVSMGWLKNGVSHLKLKTCQNSLEDHRKSCHSQQNSSHNVANQVRDTAQEQSDTLRQNFKVTIPKPFRMMLREEDRKRRNVKTRSEMELENERLRKELDELKECGRKFRAKPAPASTHMLLYDIIEKRPNKFQHQKNQISPNNLGHHENHHQQGTQRRAPPIPQQPFSFIERERKKREKKLADELNNLTSIEERRVFKARPVPKSLYRPSSPSYQLYGAVGLHTREHETHRHSVLTPSILEDTLQESDDAEHEYDDEFPRPQNTDKSLCNSSLRKWKNKGALQMEVEMERKRNRDRDWSYIHPLRRTSLCHSQELLNTCKSDYISV